METVNDDVSRETKPDQLTRIAKIGVDRMQAACALWNELTDELVVPMVIVMRMGEGKIDRMTMVAPNLERMPPAMLIDLFQTLIEGLKKPAAEVPPDDVKDDLARVVKAHKRRAGRTANGKDQREGGGD